MSRTHQWMFTLLLPIFLCAFLANPCMAHDFWVEKAGGTLKVIYGHGIQRLPYDPATIKEVQAFDAKGKEVKISIEKKKESATLMPKGPVSMVTMTVDDGFWVKTVMGLKKGTKREVRRAIESYQAMDYSKAILSWGEGAGNPLGLKLEIIPLANPFEMKAGQKLAVKVLLEGQPLPNAEVESIEHTKTAKTNEKGIAEIPLSGEGMKVITTRYRIALKGNPDADALKMTSTLTFGGKESEPK